MEVNLESLKKAASVNDVAFNPFIKSGIYVIINNLSGKFYLGKSINVNKRLKSHKWYLRKGNHQNIHLQRAFNKDKEENFSFYLLEQFESNGLLEREEFLISTLKPQYNLRQISSEGKYVFNEETTKKKIENGKKYFLNNPNSFQPLVEYMKIYGPWNKGKKNHLSNEIRNKISQAQKIRGSRHLHTPELVIKRSITRTKKVYQYDLNNNLLKEWSSTESIYKEYNEKSKSTLKNTIRAGGILYDYIWTYNKN